MFFCWYRTWNYNLVLSRSALRLLLDRLMLDLEPWIGDLIVFIQNHSGIDLDDTPNWQQSWSSKWFGKQQDMRIMLRVEAVFMCRGNCKAVDRVMASGWFQTNYLGDLLGRYHFFISFFVLFFNGGGCKGWRQWILPLWGARLCKRRLPKRSPGLAPARKSRCICNCRLQLRDLECVPGSWIRRKSTCSGEYNTHCSSIRIGMRIRISFLYSELINLRLI